MDYAVKPVRSDYIFGEEYTVPLDEKVLQMSQNLRDEWGKDWLKKSRFKVRYEVHVSSGMDREHNLISIIITTFDYTKYAF